MQYRIIQFVKGIDIGGQNGGSENFGINLSLALVAKGWEVTLIYFQQHHTETEFAIASTLTANRIKIIVIKNLSIINLIYNLQRVERECIDQNNVCIIHSHFQIGNLIALLLKLRNPKTIILRTAHITKEWGSTLVARILNNVFTQWVFPIGFDAQVAVSNTILKQISNYPGTKFSQRKPVFIPNGIPDHFFQESQKTDIALHNPCEKEIIIGSVGRLISRKNYEILLLAFPEILEKYPGAKILLVGDGDRRKHLEHMAEKLKFKEKIYFAGQQQDILKWLFKMHLFVLPSTAEGLPTVILEAWNCGVPVIASDIPEVRELIEPPRTGWLFDPTNSKQLANIIIDILDNYDNTSSVINNAFHKLKDYSFSKISQQYSSLYFNLSE
ncbi:MAG: glycosyltransferase family 4 protein [Bellilinea sp.]|jgi:glycosyltransferase involved in cell wall biosynthesis